MSLREMLSDYWYAFQQELFPRLEGELGPMGERYELFVAVLELVRVEALLPYFRGQVGRPEEDRAALARAFIAKAVFDVPTTRGLIERLEVDGRLCRLCGWSGAGRLPSEATFSRAFSEFAESGLASRLHETLIARTMDGHLVEHISRDATAIEAREKPAPKPKAAKPKRRKRGRPRKGEAQRSRPAGTATDGAFRNAALPRACDVGSKRNCQGPYHLLDRWTPPVMRSSLTSPVRCCRGDLLTPLACMEIRGTRVRELESDPRLPDPVSFDRLPLPVLRPSRSGFPRFALSRSPVAPSSSSA